MSYKITLSCLYFSLLGAFLLFLQPVMGQYDFSGVDDMLQKNGKVLGKDIVVLVWKDGKIIYKKETGEDFTAKTQVPLGASGQWLTAAVSMIYIDEDKINLDTKAGKLIPILAKYMKAYINLRHCLTHTTGLEAEKAGIGKLLPKSKFESLEEEVNYFATKREIVTNPQTEFYYSQVGMNIAGRMLEVTSRKTFDRVVQEKLLRPLKMRSTTFFNYDNLYINPSAGLQSTANDYMNFLVMMLNNGMFEGKRILSEASIEEMEKAQFTSLPVKYTPKGTEGLHYGLGIWLMEEDGNSRGSVLSSPSFTGTWPYIDRKNNYAAILLVKPRQVEQEKEIYTQFKAAVDQAIGVK